MLILKAPVLPFFLKELHLLFLLSALGLPGYVSRGHWMTTIEWKASLRGWGVARLWCPSLIKLRALYVCAPPSVSTPCTKAGTQSQSLHSGIWASQTASYVLSPTLTEVTISQESALSDPQAVSGPAYSTENLQDTVTIL